MHKTFQPYKIMYPYQTYISGKRKASLQRLKYLMIKTNRWLKKINFGIYKKNVNKKG